MERTTEVSRGYAAGGGVVAGLIGGIVLAIILAIVQVAYGGDIWVALKGASTPFLHERAAQPGFDGPAVALGLVIHFAISIVWGVLFALIAFGLSRGATVLAGAVWGVVVWLVMYYVVLPAVGLAQVARSQPIVNAVVGHVIFGLAVGLGFLPFQRPRVVTPVGGAPLPSR